MSLSVNRSQQICPSMTGGRSSPAHPVRSGAISSPTLTIGPTISTRDAPTGTPRAGYPTTLAKVFDVDSWLYGPLVRAGGRVAERVSRSHVGIPQWYLMWQVAGMVIVLLVLFSLMR